MDAITSTMNFFGKISLSFKLPSSFYQNWDLRLSSVALSLCLYIYRVMRLGWKERNKVTEKQKKKIKWGGRGEEN